MYNARMNYADPHSGNYLFMSDGRLGLLDFGCIQRYDAEEFEILMSAERLVDGWQHLPEMARRCGFPEKKLKDKAFMDLVRESCSWVLTPVQVDGPFDFSDETHFKRGVEIFTRMALKRYTPAHPLFVYWNRSIIGIRALMYQLRAQVDVRAVFNRERGWPDPKFDTA
jgi:aarF domain-containing kinase